MDSANTNISHMLPVPMTIGLSFALLCAVPSPNITLVLDAFSPSHSPTTDMTGSRINVQCALPGPTTNYIFPVTSRQSRSIYILLILSALQLLKYVIMHDVSSVTPHIVAWLVLVLLFMPNIKP
jgi:hypothetical protein